MRLSVHKRAEALVLREESRLFILRRSTPALPSFMEKTKLSFKEEPQLLFTEKASIFIFSKRALPSFKEKAEGLRPRKLAFLGDSFGPDVADLCFWVLS